MKNRLLIFCLIATSMLAVSITGCPKKTEVPKQVEAGEKPTSDEIGEMDLKPLK